MDALLLSAGPLFATGEGESVAADMARARCCRGPGVEVVYNGFGADLGIEEVWRHRWCRRIRHQAQPGSTTAAGAAPTVDGSPPARTTARPNGLPAGQVAAILRNMLILNDAARVTMRASQEIAREGLSTSSSTPSS